MTKQEAFEKAYLGLRAQKWERSMREFDKGSPEICAYRGYSDRKCAIGHLVTDEEAFQMDRAFVMYRMPSTAIDELIKSGLSIPSLEGLDPDFLAMLQAMHDSGHTTGGMEDNFLEFAKLHRLTVPE